jgi:hypothetical protein
VPRARAAITRTEYFPEFGRAVRIHEYDRPMMSDDIETAQTVSFMDEIAATDANDAAVRNATAEALDDAGIDERASAMEKATAVYWWLKRTITYVPTPGTSPLVDQTLITPCTVLAMPDPIGDCPQFSMLAAAMFRVLCMDSMFVTIAAEPGFPDLWSHIYNTVEVFPGQYMPFDSSNGPEPGAEYAEPYKRRVWPRIIPGRCSERSKEAMLRKTYAARAIPTMRNRALRGALGDLQCDSDGNCYDSGTLVSAGNVCTDPSCMMSGPNVNLNDPALQMDSSGGSLSPGGSYSSPSSASSSPSWLTALINDVGSIGSSALKASTQKQPYYITGPNGQAVLYNPNTGTVAGTSAIGTVSPTIILFGILGLGAVALLSKK